MKNGYFKDESGNIIEHELQYPNGVQKGLKTILKERNLWEDWMRRSDAQAKLEEQEDFSVEQLKPYLVETIEKHGGLIDFYPKYHPELNFIEMY